jgi:AcrR family transcriptional regulator
MTATPSTRDHEAGRRARTDKAILDATRELLAEGGVRELTVERVSARSGVAKTTIYRRWRGKHELALAVLIDMVENVVSTPDLDDTRKELITFVDSVVRAFASTPQGPAMQALVSEIATHPDLGRVYREQVVEPRRETLRPVIERGVARGDLRPDTDLRIVHELLLGPVFYRLLLSGPPLDRKLSESVADAVLDAFAPSPSATTRKRARRPARRRASGARRGTHTL